MQCNAKGEVKYVCYYTSQFIGTIAIKANWVNLASCHQSSETAGSSYMSMMTMSVFSMAASSCMKFFTTVVNVSNVIPPQIMICLRTKRIRISVNKS